MYLKSLEVHGFKSFADKLVFEFHHGITAIVGPNGSGKSNVADSVRWVLGEQSAKQLRGAKMEDVIFAGTQLRRPLGYAYVAITINNSDHKLNVPYEEVKIARRVYRSGESEYLLNGTSCRLRDVQELLFDTGIGKEGYSIIGQGQIDKILSGKPEERRELFDEAAGIVKYKKRKSDAEKNLEEERQNLVRIEDILSELSKQVEPLRHQSDKAKEYLKYRDRLKELDVNMFLMEYDKANTEIAEVDNKIKIAEGDLSNSKLEFEDSRKKYEELDEKLIQYNNDIDKGNEELAAKRVDCNNCENNIKILDEQINAVFQNREHYKEQTQNCIERKKILTEELFGCQKECLDNDRKIEETDILLKENESKIEEVAAKISDAEGSIQLCRNNMLEVINETSDIKSERQKFETLIGQNDIKKSEYANRMLHYKSEISVLEETHKEQKELFDDLSEKISQINVLEDELKVTLNRINSDTDNFNREHRDVQQKFHIENSRLNSLKNMTERYEGFGQSIKRVMEQKEENSGIIGVVADIIRVKKEYELAVETALGGSIQNIVTDNEQTAKNMIQYLKKNKYGRATFLPLTNVKAKPAMYAGGIMSQEGVIGIASSLVETEDRFSGLIEYLLGRFIVVDNIDNAIVLANKYHHTIRIVTVEGDLLNTGGSMSGGAFKNSNNLLGRRREMEDLQERVKDLKSRLLEIESEIKENEKNRSEISKKLSDDEKIKQELIIRQNTAKINCDRAYADIEDNNRKLEQVQFEAKGIEDGNRELRSQMQQILERISDNDDRNKLFEEEIAELSSKLEEHKNIEKLAAQKNSEIMLELAALSQKKEFIDENIKRIEGEINKTDKELSDALANSKNADIQVSEKREEIEAVKKDIEKIKIEEENLSNSMERLKTQRDEISVKHKSFLLKREELSGFINELDKECFRLNNHREKLMENIDAYTSYMWEQYELTYHTAKELKTDTDMDFSKIKAGIAKIKADIKALGDVNINAIEQYKEIMERYELLNSQHADLTEAADVLVGIIEDLDVEMRRRFEEEFEKIKSQFDKVFKELFGGGRGTIELASDEDILLSGITIIAQPPGKKLQNMMQLSGGEKALTAIALLFAIQSLKPSPFCLLDEIEAALDDSNVDRYANYLHKLTTDTQFIVITHRRGTMNSADILYGITMQEKGVSTLVSVNLLDEKEIANYSNGNN